MGNKHSSSNTNPVSLRLGKSFRRYVGIFWCCELPRTFLRKGGRVMNVYRWVVKECNYLGFWEEGKRGSWKKFESLKWEQNAEEPQELNDKPSSLYLFSFLVAPRRPCAEASGPAKLRHRLVTMQR